MLSKILSSATYGIDAYLVEVETHVEKQIPGFIIVVCLTVPLRKAVKE